MKYLNLIIIAIAIISFSSCSLFKKGNKGHSKEEQMKMDAYAMANTKCEYQLLQLGYLDDKSNKKLKAERDIKKDEVTRLTTSFFARYKENKAEFNEFKKLVVTVSPELTTCKKIKEIEIQKKEAKENSINPDKPKK